MTESDRNKLGSFGGVFIGKIYSEREIKSPQDAVVESVVKIIWNGERTVIIETTWKYNLEDIKKAVNALRSLADELENF